MAYPQAVKFMETAGFDFSGDVIELKVLNNVLIADGLDQINIHIVSLGGKVAVESNFDPTKQYKISNAEDKFKPPGLGKEEEDKYDPTKVGDMVMFIKKERES